MDKILLIGIRGTYNLGCEAIVRGTVTLLKRIYPKAMIYYASYDYKNDVTRLSDCDVNILNRPTKKRWSVRNIVRKLLSYVSIEYIPPYEKISLIKEFDAVFSIGGDMYTLWSDGSYCKDLIRLGDQCLALGIPYILWGCSVGPFEKNPKALSVFKEHLQHLPLIVAREYATIDYLKTIGIEDNVFFAPDPSFFVAPECGVVAPERKHRIGVNLSPLSTQHLFATLEEGIEQQARALEKLIDENQAEVILLPHVLSPDKSDNDLLYLQRVYKAMDVSYQQKTTLVDTDLSFVALKKQLQRCDVVISGTYALCT